MLDRVPKIHLLVLDALLLHLRDLIESTEEAASSEPGESDVKSNAEYIAKLGASLGPCILRPAVENSKTLNDRFPAQLFVDLVKDYARLLPPTLEKRTKVEEERYAPKRQRTKMVDQRVTRSTTALKDNKKHSDWLKEELERKMGHKIMEEPETLPTPVTPVKTETVEEAPNPPSKVESSTLVLKDEEVKQEEEEYTEESRIPPVPNIIRPMSSSSESEGGLGEKTPGFVTPTEELAAPSHVSPSSERTNNTAEPPQTAATTTSLANIDTNDDDKPLAASSSLARSSTGSSSARRNPLARSGATRGPRPMSVHAPPSSAGGSTGSASSAAGVRARAAMFESRASPK